MRTQCLQFLLRSQLPERQPTLGKLAIQRHAEGVCKLRRDSIGGQVSRRIQRVVERSVEDDLEVAKEERDLCVVAGDAILESLALAIGGDAPAYIRHKARLGALERAMSRKESATVVESSCVILDGISEVSTQRSGHDVAGRRRVATRMAQSLVDNSDLSSEGVESISETADLLCKLPVANILRVKMSGCVSWWLGDERGTAW